MTRSQLSLGRREGRGSDGVERDVNTGEIGGNGLRVLGLSTLAFVDGVDTAVNILQATAGSVLTLASGTLPPGKVLNSAARTLTGAPTTLGNYTFTLLETLADTPGSPKSTTFTVAVGVELAALTFGAATLTATTPVGASVQTITGKTAGSTLALVGDAFTNGYLAVNQAGTAIVVGVNGPFAEGTETGTYRVREVLDGAFNTPNLSPEQNSIVVTDAAVVPAPLAADYRAAVAAPPLNETAGNLGFLLGPTAAQIQRIFGGNTVTEGAIAIKVRLRPGVVGTDGNKTSTFILGCGTTANVRAWNLAWLGGGASAANAGRFQWNYQRGNGDNIPSIMARRIAPNDQGVVEAFLVFRRKNDASGTWEALAIAPGDTAVVAPTGDEVVVDDCLGIEGTTEPLRLFSINGGGASPFNYVGGCELSNFIYIQGASGTDAEWLRVANGESPATVFPAHLDFWYRLGGLNDLAKTAGSRTGADFAVNGTGVYTSTALLPTPGPDNAANSIYIRGSDWGHVHALPPSAFVENEEAQGGVDGIMAKTTTVFLPGTIGGAATRVEVRVCREDDGEVIQDWTLRDVADGTGEALTGNHELIVPNVRPANGLGHIYDVRRQDDPTCIFRYRAREDVGVVAMPVSQSQMSRAFTTDAGSAGTGLVAPVAAAANTVSMTLYRVGTNAYVPVATSGVRVGWGTNGLAAFANNWVGNFPNLKLRIPMAAVAGTSTQEWLEDKNSNGTPLNNWGDYVTPSSGSVTGLMLSVRNRVTTYLVSWHTEDRAGFAGWPERFSELYSLNEASAEAAIPTSPWTVAYGSRKSFAKVPGGLPFPPHITLFPVSREALGAMAAGGAFSTINAQRKQQADYASLGTGRAAGILTYLANYQSAISMLGAVEPHQTNDRARGNVLFSVEMSQGLSRAGGLAPGWNVGAGRALPSVSGYAGAGTPTITASFAIPAGWTLRPLQADATEIEDFWVSENSGAWVRARSVGTVTLSGAQVLLNKTASSWHPNTRVQYNAGAPVSTGTLATDNTQLGGLLFAQMPAGEPVRALWSGATNELVDGLPIATDISPVVVS